MVGGLLLAAHTAIVLVMTVVILRRRQAPISMLAWIFAIGSLPVAGVVLYLLLGSTRVRSKVSRKRRRVQHLLSRFARWAEQHTSQVCAIRSGTPPEDLRSVEQLGQRVGQMPATSGNDVRIYHAADDTYSALSYAIRAARQHVHMQYYIWQPDETGRLFRDLLVEKAREGVECRVLLDAVGCLATGSRFFKPLTEAGVQVAFFLPLTPLRRRRWSLNLRNHRKIVVIDGNTAFFGSQNIGDEYRGRKRKLSPWFDSHMRVQGAAALFLQQVFAEDWLFATRKLLNEDGYFPQPSSPGNCLVQILPSGPEQDASALAEVVFAAVATARRSIRIATPYFVPDPALEMALRHACHRGVHVELVVPSRTDARVALWAGRSFYPELLDAGVDIYEFDGGVLHSKLMTVDDRWCMLGSANMDVRSFRLNFEITALVYDELVAAEQARHIAAYMGRSRRITARDAWGRPFGESLLVGAARLLAPLL